MEKETYMSEVIDVIDKKRACDEACKKVLASKEIASRILKEVVPEYKNCSIEEIMNYISNVKISAEPVDPDVTAPVIALDNSEDSTVLEGKRLYDIKFTVRAPGDIHEIVLIINIEGQKEYKPGYILVKRGIYYCCRLISSQYGTVFTGSDYNKLQKVYSIWICTDPDKAHKNTITRYNISPTLLFGEALDETDRSYDMMSLVMVCLGDDNNSENELISLLTTLFSIEISASKKKAVLQSKYGIKMTEPFDKEVDKMCNISEMYFENGMEKGIKKGMEKGMKKGIEKGIEKGMKKGIEKGIKKGIETAKTQTALKLLHKNSFSLEEIADLTELSIEEVKKLAAQNVS